jgi:hypothetical protein
LKSLMLSSVVALMVPTASRVKNAWWPVRITFGERHEALDHIGR